MDKLIPVFYTPKMVAESGCASPSAAKPAKVVASWQSQFPITIIEPDPVTVDDYARAHDRQWVEQVLACKADNGFENRSADVAKALPYTSGSMLSGARYVLKHGGAVAAPCSGFHHAEHSRAMGYCTFNGLMVTALALRAEGLAKKVGILDLDMHYGNGTDHILARCNEGTWCKHYTGGQYFKSASQAKRFFDTWLIETLASVSECDVVLYQAGADPHIDDPHGGWLTTPELHRRDTMVFDALAEREVPVVWNLAGGYQVEQDGTIPKVLEIHDNTMRECVRVYGTVKA